MKVCNNCKQEKHESEFTKNKQSKDGLYPRCKSCKNQYYENNKELIKNKRKQYYDNNKESIKIKNKQYYDNNIEQQRLKSITYYNNNKEEYSYKRKEYRLKNNDKINKKKRQNYHNNKEKYLYKRKEYLPIANKLKKIRYNTDINYKLKCLLRNRLYYALNKNVKSQSTMKLLGCSINELKLHLQQTAISNGYIDFNIEDYNSSIYHVDHIKPCSSFDLSKEEEQKKCFHYTNLQILTAKENLKKSDNFAIFIVAI